MAQQIGKLHPTFLMLALRLSCLLILLCSSCFSPVRSMSHSEKDLKLERDAVQLEQQIDNTPRPKSSRWRNFIKIGLILYAMYTVLHLFQAVSSLEKPSSWTNNYTHKSASPWREERAAGSYLYDFMSRRPAFRACPHSKNRPRTREQVEQTFLEVPDAESARNASHSFTGETHIAGTEADKRSALRLKKQWENLLGLEETGPEENIFEAGTKESRTALIGHCTRGKRRHHHFHKLWKFLSPKRLSAFSRSHKEKPKVWIDTYYPLMNYPVSHSLTLTPLNATFPSFTAKLQEDVLAQDSTSQRGPPTFHGFSASGNVSGELIYAGQANRADFDRLLAEGIEIKGKIVLCQYSGSFRGLKVQAAADYGAVGVLIYSDPLEDGKISQEAGYKVYPHGPARQPSSVQRGSVQFLSVYPGDPLTPGTPAYKNALRLPRNDSNLNIPKIPSLPISYQDAIPLLKSLKGSGIRRESSGSQREGGLEYLGVEYWTGPGKDLINLNNEMKEQISPIWNVYMKIEGHMKDEIVILGNHRDAWTFGAADPISGTASVHEIIRGLKILLAKGWKPLRTILIISWDAEEQGLIGSSEFVEDFSQFLSERVVAYLNVDVAVAGTVYDVGASPSLANLFIDIAKSLPNPEAGNETLFTKWRRESFKPENLVAPLGSGSDFTGFLQHLGIAAGNVGFRRNREIDPVYHYHSNYDSRYWMDNFGDPTFSHHVTVAKSLGLSLLRLADEIILPLNVTDYAKQLERYAESIPALVKKIEPNGENVLNLTRLGNSIASIHSAAKQIDQETQQLKSELHSFEIDFNGKSGRKAKISLMKRVRSVNKRLQHFERGFIDEQGLDKWPWYKSLVVAPGRYLGYGATPLPGLTESLSLDKNLTRAEFELDRLVNAFDRVAHNLEP